MVVLKRNQGSYRNFFIKFLRKLRLDLELLILVSGWMQVLKKQNEILWTGFF